MADVAPSHRASPVRAGCSSSRASPLRSSVRGARRGRRARGHHRLRLASARLLGEFDGRVKYGRLLRPGQTPGDVVWAEKLREDALRRTTGFGMERLVWADLDRPRSTADRLWAMLRRAA